MHSAPPVLVPVGRFVWGHGVTAALAGLVALAMGWVWQASGASALQGVAGGLLCLLAAALSWHWAKQEALPAGTLSWDGGDWTYAPHETQGTNDALAVTVRVLWDAGPAMLVAVRTQAAGGAVQFSGWRGQRFAWMHATHMAGQWHAWRCAVYADDIL